MKNRKSLIILNILVPLLLVGCEKSPTLSVQSIDDKGIYVGEGPSGLESPTEGEARWEKTVINLNQGWEYIRIGGRHEQTGQYNQAIEAYKKSYEVDPGNGLMSGKLLLELYEKLHRYDEALTLVDDIVKHQPLGDYGKERYAEIRTRLLAAKNKA